MGGNGGGVVFGSELVGLECGGDGDDWTDEYSLVGVDWPGGGGGCGNVRCGENVDKLALLFDGTACEMTLMTPAFGVCLGDLGNGGRVGGPGRAGGVFDLFAGTFGMPRLL